MAYNLYQVQMAKAWAERIDKETATAEKFWADQAMKTTQMMGASSPTKGRGPGSCAGSLASSAAPSGYTSKTSFLKTKLERLEAELQQERTQRVRIENELLATKGMMVSSKPGTPTGSQR